MRETLKNIEQSGRSLAILIDPEKMKLDAVAAFAETIPTTILFLQKNLHIDQFFFFVGGSTMENTNFDRWVKKLKQNTPIPVVIFPGSCDQLSENADALLFLHLISGRNTDYLIDQQVNAAKQLKETALEIIPTGYVLIDGGKETAVQRISKTLPLPQNKVENIINHAYAAQLMGNQLVYLEAGSGAKKSVSVDIVRKVSDQINVPLIVGGGLRTMSQIEAVYEAGAKMVVIGTAIEENINWNG
ncbi:MAG: geranylgeranylglyceryl/heptaprenylglyceryl phosphate synthase [Nonlabens sp.]|jgi:phosphoglycerol geranylgeranyltransferase|uniref:geranylgeranylglyceryl/heptaprenylglyceryl phosphate synthase n=1 Tax=Nonlabens sp. TaxID=1888209 RepID=UPI0035A6D042